MDSHVHLIGNTKLKGYESIGESSYLSTIYGVDNAKKTLLAGFHYSKKCWEQEIMLMWP